MVELWPFGIYAAAVAVIVVTMLIASALLGERHREPQTGTTYEGGVVPVGPVYARVASEFYLVAAFFVVFDVETIFLFAWVIAARSFGWSAFAALAVFVGLLGSALAYLWRVGALDWNRRMRQVAGMAAEARAHGG